ncbi:MAG: type II toxin-antitoxin system RelE/ParE family toxin [Bacteroidota bacterium]
MAVSYQVVVTTRAKRDINKILDYELENNSRKRALEVRREIIDAIHSLAEMPEARNPVQEVVKLTQDIVFRQVVAKETYRIIYRIREVKKGVVVMRVMHVKRGPGFVKDALL